MLKHGVRGACFFLFFFLFQPSVFALPERAQGVWVRGTEYVFFPASAEQRRHLVQLSLEENQRGPGPGEACEKGPEGAKMEFLRRVPVVGTLMNVRSRVFDTAASWNNNPDNRIIFPFMGMESPGKDGRGGRDGGFSFPGRGEKQDRLGTGIPSLAAQTQKSSRDDEEQQYYLGYRLNSSVFPSLGSWYVGFGLKRAERQTKEEKPEARRKNSGSSPVIGIVGQF